MALLPVVLSAALAAPPAALVSSHWSPRDIVLQESVLEVALAPDGSGVVWLRQSADLAANRRVSNLWFSALAGGPPRQLTRGSFSDHSPELSPDGTLLAFLSDRTETKESKKDDQEATGDQIWLLPLAGGEPWRLTERPSGVRHLAWRDSGHIVFTAEEAPDRLDRARKERKDDTLVVEDEERQQRVRLFEVAVAAKKVRRVTSNLSPITALAVSPNGSSSVVQITVSPHFEADARVKPETYVVDLTTGAMRRVLAERPATPKGFAFAGDGSAFFFCETYASDSQLEGAGIEKLYRFELATGSSNEVDLAWPRGLADSDAFTPLGDDVLVLLADGAVNRLAWISREAGGWHQRLLSEVDHATGIAAARDGASVAYERSTASSLGQWYGARIEGGVWRPGVQLTDLNASLAAKPRARAEVVRWAGARDEEVEGILYYPLEYREGQRYPLVVMIHGGPSGVDLDSWDETWATAPQLYSQRGAFVLKPNYHGSSNYGLEFVESIKGHYYELEVPDILRGVDTLIARGLVDGDKLAVLGWSNGAILTIQLTVESDRFKAAAPGAGDVNWISDFGTCAFGARFDTSYLGGTPWSALDTYLAKSPLLKLARVHTPTLIFFGTEDTSVPTEQGWQHYRALQQLGTTPVRFLLFPGEPHSLRKPAHQLRKLEEELAWFDRYLFGGPPAPTEWRTSGSPLDLALARLRVARSLSGIGASDRGVLLPETVPVPSLGGVQVGVFEVTRAQWAAFAGKPQLDPASANLPVAGVAAEQAQGYCDFLSRRTGARYRLPRTSELKTLREVAVGAANTLDRWAGFKVTPDDLATLAPLLEALGPADSRLDEVGHGDLVLLDGDEQNGPALFDVAGNAAEWAIGESGAPELAGGCAACPEDAEAAATPPLALAGLRVVKEAR